MVQITCLWGTCSLSPLSHVFLVSIKPSLEGCSFPLNLTFSVIHCRIFHHHVQQPNFLCFFPSFYISLLPADFCTIKIAHHYNTIMFLFFFIILCKHTRFCVSISSYFSLVHALAFGRTYTITKSRFVLFLSYTEFKHQLYLILLWYFLLPCHSLLTCHVFHGWYFPLVKIYS